MYTWNNKLRLACKNMSHYFACCCSATVSQTVFLAKMYLRMYTQSPKIDLRAKIVHDIVSLLFIYSLFLICIPKLSTLK